MIVDLRNLQPNPLRDFTIDPVDDAKVAELKASIKEDGFWGGIVCRRVNGRIEIAAGHHRVKAAIAAGIRSADLFVADDLDDAAMVRVYARENATQRGNSGTAIAGTIAAAIRFLAKQILTGRDLAGIPARSQRALETIRGNLVSSQGLGWETVLEFLERVPGINKNSVIQQLANLKASGDYARIIGQVTDEIEREQREALKALERAEREQREAEARATAAEAKRKEAIAAAKAAREERERKAAQLAEERAKAEAALAEKRRAEAERDLKQFDALRKTRDTARKAAETSAQQEVTFDFEGVAAHLTVAHHIDTFRALVTSPGLRPRLAVNQQAKLAKSLVDLAAKREVEITAPFIREHVTTMLLGVKQTERRISQEERQQALAEDAKLRAQHYQHEAIRHGGQMLTNLQRLIELFQRWPKGVPVPIAPKFKSTLQGIQQIIAAIDRRL